jgi:hypothetical protein
VLNAREGEGVRGQMRRKETQRYLRCSETVKATLNIQSTQRFLKMAGEILCFGVPCDWRGTQGDILYPRSLDHEHG